MTRCPSGHFYDASKGSCPTCARLGQAPGPTRPSAAPPPPPPPGGVSRPPGASTRPLGGVRPTTPQPQGGPPSPASQVTRAIWPQELGTDPIVGWLVAYRGKAVGRDYRLRTGRMRIGRGDTQDVQIDDEHISRENHAFIVFDPLNCVFLLQPGEGRGLVYLSKKKQKPELVSQPEKLSKGDIIILGKTNLVFVPFCEPGSFQWQETGGTVDPWEAGQRAPGPDDPDEDPEWAER